MKVTIRDVAKYTGVSVGTVSRALNGYLDINPDTKKRIIEAAEELGYTPNVNARSLSSKVAPNLGVIVSGMLDSNGKDNFILLLLQGVYRYALPNNLEVALYTTDPANQIKKTYSKFCSEHNISGAILSGITTDDPYFKELVSLEMPCVLIDVKLEGKRLGCVSVDNYKASGELAQHLIDANHKNIMVLSGKKNAAVNVERLAGIYSTFEKNGLSLTRDHVMNCEFSEEVAYKKIKKYIQKYGKTEVTAFLCLSDIMALGALKAINEEGYSVPEDFSMVGFDGIPITEYLSPPLTTIAQDVVEIGYQSAKLLQELIKEENVEKNVYVPHKLVKGGSVKVI